MPKPRGSRPSIAALTRAGERKASDIVMRIERSVFFSRAEMDAMVWLESVGEGVAYLREDLGLVTATVARLGCPGKMAHDDLLLVPPPAAVIGLPSLRSYLHNAQ